MGRAKGDLEALSGAPRSPYLERGSLCVLNHRINKKVPRNSYKAQFESKAAIEDIMRLLVS